MLNNPQVRTSWLTTVMLLLLLPSDPCKQQGMKNFSNRQEGCNVRRNAGADFKLIGLYSRFQQFSSNSNLKVGFFVPSLKDSKAHSISVQAVEIQNLFNYFMRSNDSTQWHENAWNVFKPWPTKDIIDPLRLHSQNVAVIAFYKNNNGRSVFLPVDVATDDGKPAIGKYTFQLMHEQYLQSLDLVVTNSAGKEVRNSHEPQVPCNYRTCILWTGGNTLLFDLDVSSLPEDEYRLKLTGHRRDASDCKAPTTSMR